MDKKSFQAENGTTLTNMSEVRPHTSECPSSFSSTVFLQNTFLSYCLFVHPPTASFSTSPPLSLFSKIVLPSYLLPPRQPPLRWPVHLPLLPVNLPLSLHLASGLSLHHSGSDPSRDTAEDSLHQELSITSLSCPEKQESLRIF